MTTQNESLYEELENGSRLNRAMYRFTGFLGLTTGLGVIVWGLWSILATLATFVYEETGISTDEILINNGVNQGLLLSSIVIALGVVILELKQTQALLHKTHAEDRTSDVTGRKR